MTPREQGKGERKRKRWKPWWAGPVDGYVPIFSGQTLPITREHDFPDIFQGNVSEPFTPTQEAKWFCAREQLWAIEEGLVNR